ncbi:MAG: tetratricopeptide repeat protein [Pyrinomonadaceae bacterium]
MNSRRIHHFLVSALLVFTLLTLPLQATAQGVVEVAGIGGDSSVFVFRKTSATPVRTMVRTRAVRTKEDRIETARRVSRQYVALAKVKPRRSREKPVDPENLPSAIRLKQMSKEEASKLFAGVGEYYIDSNDSNFAIRFFREAVALDPANPVAPKGLSEALSLKGSELLVKDQQDEAKTYFDEALKYNPTNAVAYYGLGEIYANRAAASLAGSPDDDSRSIANYEKALQFDKDLTEIYTPLGILYYQSGQIAKADEMLTKAVAADPDSAIAQYFLGLVRFSQNRNTDALAAFQRATALQANYAEAYYYTGETLDRLGRTAEAVPMFEKALAAKPKYFEAQFSLGNAYYELKQWPAAVDAYEKAVRLKNDSIQTYINLGDAYRELKDYEKAESRYNLAVAFLERDKNFDKYDAADTYSKIGYVIAQQCPINISKFMPCRWETATRSLEKAAALTGDNVDYANLGWAYYNAAKRDAEENRPAAAREKLEKAKLNLQRAVAADSKFLNAPLSTLGMALNDLGEYSTAAEVLKRVVKAQPNWSWAYNQLGIAYYGMKDHKNAIQTFRTATERDPNFAMGWYYLARAHFDSGNTGEAKKAYQRLRKLNANMLADRLDRETNGAMSR